MEDLYTDAELADMVAQDGLADVVQYGVDADYIADPETRELFIQAKRALDALEERLDANGAL